MTEQADKPSVEGLIARIRKCESMIGRMCAEGQPPLMSIPVDAERDEDIFICDTFNMIKERLASEAAPAAQPAQEPKHRPSQEWYADMIAATLDDDFTIGHRTAAAQPIYWRHRKTGGVYRLVGHAQLQTDGPLVDMANVTVYRGEDGKLWARASGECGSRFDRVDAPPAAAPATPLREVLSDEQIIEIAHLKASVYRHRSDPDEASFGFMRPTLLDFARALLAASSDEDRKLADRLKLEAQIQAQEARTANATIAEIYQLITGATGEPGNWHGAQPVRAYIAEQRKLMEQARDALELMCRSRGSTKPIPAESHYSSAYETIAALRSRLDGEKT